MNIAQKYLIVIGGPTASGKTSLAIQLAQHFKTEILSSDSRQFYREMNIGTAKPTKEELNLVPHHFINMLSIRENYSVGDFEREALKVLKKIYQKKKTAILVGGSGLFIRALCEGLDEFPDVPNAIRQEVEEIFKKHGIEPLQEELKRLDPNYYKKVDLNNPLRLMRALAVCRASGQPFSSFQNQLKAKRFFKPIYLKLEMERHLLYERINKRVDVMMEKGLLEEAKQLYPFRTYNALQTLGYQELFDFFEDKISLEEAIKLIKRNSRRYAKRQLTWFRKRNHWKAFDINEQKAVIEYLESLNL